MFEDCTPPTQRPLTERDRIIIRLRAASPVRSNKPQTDAAHLPLFVSANEPTLF